MVKVITLFLVVILVLGMFGKLRVPRLPGVGAKQAAKCKACGRPRIGRGPCECGKAE